MTNDSHTQPVHLTRDEHQTRHKLLHAALDELVADFLSHHRDSPPSATSVMRLIEWSSEQQEDPTP